MVGVNEVLERDGRDAILKAIADARSVARDVDARLGALPPWALAPGSPLGEDLQRLTDAAQIRQVSEVIITQLERRLSGPGPIWNILSADERKAFDAWIGAISVQNDILGKLMPSETEKDIQKVALFVIGLGALFSPLLWTEDAEPERKPIRPIRPPSWFAPSDRARIPMAPPAPAPSTSVFRPSAFRPTPSTVFQQRQAIPAASITSADLMKIQIPMNPFQGAGPVAAAPIREVAPGVFRAAPRVATGRPLAPLGPPSGPGPSMPIYPRFQQR